MPVVVIVPGLPVVAKSVVSTVVGDVAVSMIGVVAVAIMLVVSIIIIAVVGVVVTLEVNGTVCVSATSVTRVADAVAFLVSVAALGAGVVDVVAVVALVVLIAVGALDVAVVAASVKLPFRVVFLSFNIPARRLPLGALFFWSIVTEEVVFLSFVHGQPFASLFRVHVHDILDLLEVFLVQVLA